MPGNRSGYKIAWNCIPNFYRKKVSCPYEVKIPVEEREGFYYLRGMQSITSILLVTKSHHRLAEEAASEIGQWLESCGVSCTTLTADCPQETLLTAARSVQSAIVLGGDGTFVGVSRKLTGLGIPLLGINFGQVGFLAELSCDNWKPALEKLLAGELRVCSRSVLIWSLIHAGRTIRKGHAANDVVVGRGAVARILPVQVSVDGEDLGCVRSDGIIVSTPLGTSAYALSAHGALVHPDVQTLALTPISPFFRSFPPMLLPKTSLVSLKTGSPDGFLTIDGQEGFPLAEDSIIRVRSMDAGLQLVSACESSYYQRLCERGFINTRSLSVERA